jgi:hypothetical protein
MKRNFTYQIENNAKHIIQLNNRLSELENILNNL